MPRPVASLVQRGVILVWMHEEAMQQLRNRAKCGKISGPRFQSSSRALIVIPCFVLHWHWYWLYNTGTAFWFHTQYNTGLSFDPCHDFQLAMSCIYCSCVTLVSSFWEVDGTPQTPLFMRLTPSNYSLKVCVQISPVTNKF